MPVVWTDGRAVAKSSRMGSLPHFRTHLASRARAPLQLSILVICMQLSFYPSCMWLRISHFTLQANEYIEYIEISRSLCGFELHGEISMTVVLKLLSHFASVSRNRSWQSVIHDTIMIVLLRHQVRAQECSPGWLNLVLRKRVKSCFFRSTVQTSSSFVARQVVE